MNQCSCTDLAVRQQLVCWIQSHSRQLLGRSAVCLTLKVAQILPTFAHCMSQRDVAKLDSSLGHHAALTGLEALLPACIHQLLLSNP